jgi:FixJ family two-component response regulator
VRQLSEDGFKFSTIFMTGSNDDALEEKCIALGGVAFLRKPFGQRELIDALVKAGAPLSSTELGERCRYGVV